MPATTARGALPYPTSADPDDVPADMRRLAERVASTVVLIGDPAGTASTPVILTAPNGSRWRLGVDNAGRLTTTEVV